MAVETLDTGYSIQHNFHHLVLNATWFGLALASTSRFLSVYAIHAGATPLHLLLILTPFLSREWQPVWIILSTTLPALSEGISSVMFVVLMREAVQG